MPTRRDLLRTSVADALDLRIVGGDQEGSTPRFRWMIRNGAVQIVQPDLHYHGGFIRATRVARMAAAAGLPITPPHVRRRGRLRGHDPVLFLHAEHRRVPGIQGRRDEVRPMVRSTPETQRRQDHRPHRPRLGLPSEADIFQNAKKVGEE